MRRGDYFTRNGAERLSERIVDYWKLRGYFGIETKVIEHKITLPGGEEPEVLFFVRSNIGPKGFPPLTVQALAA